MKTFITVVVLSLFLICVSQASTKPKSNVETKSNTVESLIMGLESDNIGLKSSSAYMIGELELTEATIQLLRILRNDESEDLRIAAALALYKIGSPIAIYAVKQASKFDDSKRVSKHCASFYSEYQKTKIFDEEINMDVLKTALK